jgi:hypothetical protein
VKHSLIGSILPQNIGITVHRNVQVIDGRLTITPDSSTEQNEPVTRILTWRRIK